MSGNPFDGNGPAPSPYDIPRRVDGGQSAQPDHQSVRFDAASQTGSPAAKAFLNHVIKAVGVAMEQRELTTAKRLAKLMSEQRKRIDVLERQLDVERQKNAEAIGQVLGDFMDDGPSMDQLERMADQHRKDMAFKSRRTKK